MHYVLDTHPLVWFFEGSSKLSSEIIRILKGENQHLIIPALVLAEIKYLYAKGKISVPPDEVIKSIELDPRCTIYPLDLTIIERLPLSLDIHDGIICATAFVYRDVLGEKVKLITKDESIVNSRLIETIF